VAGPESCLHLQFGQRVHQCCFHLLDEPADTGEPRRQPEYRVSDQLTRTVERHVAAPLNAVQGHTPTCQFSLACEQVRRLCRPAQGDDRFVFQQHKHIGYCVIHAEPPELALQFERAAIVNATETEQPEVASRSWISDFGFWTGLVQSVSVSVHTWFCRFQIADS